MIKVIFLLCIFNFGFVLFRNIPYGKFSIYNSVVAGRERLPFGENSEKSFNLTMSNLDAMVSSHIAAGKKGSDDYRIFIIGDSSVWGVLQQPGDTLAGILGQTIQSKCQGQDISIFNFGYPSLSVMKDLLVLEQVKSLDPDLIIWLVTLESLRWESQMETPLVANNPEKMIALLMEYDLDRYELPHKKVLDHTLLNQRRDLADIIRLQLYGVLWSATGVDQDIPGSYTPAMWDLEDENGYYDISLNSLKEEDLSFEIIKQGIQKNNKTDFIVINEPILVSQGKNSDVRYNFYYPRWVYDQYRALLSEEMINSGIEYYDFWNLINGSDFTNSAIHLNKNGESLLAGEIKKIIESRCN